MLETYYNGYAKVMGKSLSSYGRPAYTGAIVRTLDCRILRTENFEALPFSIGQSVELTLLFDGDDSIEVDDRIQVYLKDSDTLLGVFYVKVVDDGELLDAPISKRITCINAPAEPVVV